jgi:hypothetical protein
MFVGNNVEEEYLWSCTLSASNKVPAPFTHFREQRYPVVSILDLTVVSVKLFVNQIVEKITVKKP